MNTIGNVHIAFPCNANDKSILPHALKPIKENEFAWQSYSKGCSLFLFSYVYFLTLSSIIAILVCFISNKMLLYFDKSIYKSVVINVASPNNCGFNPSDEMSAFFKL